MLGAERDEKTGLWRKGCVDPPYRWGTNRFPHLAGTFLFNVEHARRPLRHAAALVETCLDLFATNEYPLGAGVRDLHALFDAACALAELQRELPGLLRSERPLRLVLDRRPFV